MSSVDFSKRSLIFITGSSRGIGRALAVEISQLIHPQSILVLIASSAPALEETKSLVLQVKSTLNVVTYPVDLSKPSVDVYEKLFDEVIQKVDVSNLDYSMFIHNAGTIGSLKKTVDLDDIELWRKYYDLNLISAISLNSKFISKTKGLAKKLFIVNITSLCGRVPFVNMSMYGSCKAARELFFKVLAAEESNLTILNYSPGPVATDMFETIIETAEDDGLKKSFKETKETAILTPQKTVKMLLDILKIGDFESGQTIDYFDRMEETMATSPLMFLLKLAWDCRYRIPLIITIGFMALDIRMQFELNVQTRRIRRVSLPTSGSSNQDDTSDNQDAELDYTWTSADDALSNSTDSERPVSPEFAPSGPLDAGPSGNQYVSARISNF